jgi:hypothetical protein
MSQKLDKQTHWSLEHGPERDSTGNRTVAIFFDADDSDRRAEVSIGTQTLGQIGDPPRELTARKPYSANVLLAMLEEFTGAIRSGDLTSIDETKVNMPTLKQRFRKLKQV